MKYVKYFLISAAIAVILAAVAWYLRDTIIRRLSGPLLAEYGLTIVDVSLDALKTDSASIGYLELLHDSGTTIAIRKLVLPIGKSRNGVTTYQADAVSIEMQGPRDMEVPVAAGVIRGLLALPVNLPNTRLRVGEIGIGPRWIAQQLVWSATEREQAIELNIDGVRFAARALQHSEDAFEVVGSMSRAADGTAVQTVTVGVALQDDVVNLKGGALLDLHDALSIARSLAESVRPSPMPADFASGTADVSFEAAFPLRADRKIVVSAVATAAAPIRLARGVPPVASVSLHSATALTLTASYPELEWSLKLDRATATMSHQQWKDVAVSLQDLACRSGPYSCSSRVQLSLDSAELAPLRARRVQLSGVVDICIIDNELQILIQPNSEIRAGGLSGPEYRIETFAVRLGTAATMTFAAPGWQVAASGLDGRVESLEFNEDLNMATSVRVRALSARASTEGLTVTAGVEAYSGRATWGDLSFALPGFRGDLSLQDDGVLSVRGNVESPAARLDWKELRIGVPGFTGKLTFLDDLIGFEIMTVGLHADKEARILGQHSLSSSAGRLSVRDGAISFRAQGLAERVVPWGYNSDLRAGTVSGELDFGWRRADVGWWFDGRADLSLTNLSGYFEDIVFTGLTTEVKASYDTASGVTLMPSALSIGLVDAGLAIEKVSADYRLSLADLSVDVENLRMRAFGGDIRADPFNYQPARARNTVMFHADSIELKRLLALEEFEAVEMSGRINAELPVSIEGTTVTVAGGRLTGLEPGGVIRYRPETVEGGGVIAGMDFVTRALSNFNYQALVSDVDYGADGDLKLKMQISGRNPDMQEQRPIVLNLGIENNIPQMLRSLRASRSVEEILEKKLSR